MTEEPKRAAEAVSSIIVQCGADRHLTLLSQALGKQCRSSCPMGGSAGDPSLGQAERSCGRGSVHGNSPFLQRAPSDLIYGTLISHNFLGAPSQFWGPALLWSCIVIQAQAVNPNLVNRRTDSGTPHRFIKTKAGLQRKAVGYRVTQTVEEQPEQLCFPTLQAWQIIKPGRHWFPNTLVH